MDANQRIDYFRSEMIGRVNLLEKKLADYIAVLRAEVRQLTEKLDKLTREVKNVEMSVSLFAG